MCMDINLACFFDIVCILRPYCVNVFFRDLINRVSDLPLASNSFVLFCIIFYLSSLSKMNILSPRPSRVQLFAMMPQCFGLRFQ